MNLNIKIEKKEEKKLKFSLKEYEFIKLINSSSSSLSSFVNNENILGKVYASENDPSKLISYEILNKTLKNLIKINSLTGELILLNNSLIKIRNQIEFIVQASSSNSDSSIKLKSLTKVKIYFRYFEYLKNLSLKFDLISKEIKQINNSNSFYLNQNIEINEILFKFSFYSYNYPNDQFIISLNNHLNLFSLISSSSSLNTYLLKVNQKNLISKSIYLLNIRIKHKLSQQWLPNLKIELIIIDQTTTTIVKDEILSSTKESFRVNNELNNEFCIENKSYILNEMNSNDQIGLLRVRKSNLNLNLNFNESFISFLNESEIIINKCQMLIEELNSLINNSLKYELCYFYNDNECFNLTLINSTSIIKTKINYSKKESSFSIKSIEIIIFIILILFIISYFYSYFYYLSIKRIFYEKLFIYSK